MRPLGSICEHFDFGALWGLLGMLWTTLGTVWTSTCGLQALFFSNFEGKVWFVYFDSTLERIAIIAGPGTQVGATWAEKSSPIGPDGRRSGKSE